MRLTRLAAVGLAIGVIAGFAIALLRPRPHGSVNKSPGDVGLATEEQLWEKFQTSESAPVVELRSPRRVHG